jgi:hypothetical protein
MSFTIGLGSPYEPKVGVSAFLMPMQTRRLELRVFYRPPNTHHREVDGTLTRTPDLELCPAIWQAIPEGEWAREPFLSAVGYEPGGGRGVLEVLQAFIDLGHRLGMMPSGEKDRSAEITALRYHLEDMRKIAGLRATEQPPSSGLTIR